MALVFYLIETSLKHNLLKYRDYKFIVTHLFYISLLLKLVATMSVTAYHQLAGHVLHYFCCPDDGMFTRVGHHPIAKGADSSGENVEDELDQV
jgi:hypothetical protein